MVYVISTENKALMPCSPVIARLLLKQGKAKCIKRNPFTIKLPPVAHNQTIHLKHSDKSSINSYLGSLINHLISVFDVDIDLDRDNIVDEYVSDILNIIASDRKEMINNGD